MKVLFEIPNLTHDQARALRRAASEPGAKIEVKGMVVEPQSSDSYEPVRVEGTKVEIDSSRHGSMTIRPDLSSGIARPVEPLMSRTLGRFRVDEGERDDSPPRYRVRQRDDDEFENRPFGRMPSWAR